MERGIGKGASPAVPPPTYLSLDCNLASPLLHNTTKMLFLLKCFADFETFIGVINPMLSTAMRRKQHKKRLSLPKHPQTHFYSTILSNES